MSNQSDQLLSDRIQRLVHKLEDQPELVERVERIFQIIESENGETLTADQAEEALVQELRRMGRDAMQGWGERKQAHLDQEYKGRRDHVKREKKRSSG